MGTTLAFHDGGDHVAVRTGRIAGELAGKGDLSEYNTRWKDAIGDEILRNVTMADMVRDYGPDDWDRIFGTARKMLAEESGYRLFERKFAAGWDAIKLLVSYRWNKRRNRDFVSIRESDYVY